MTMPHFPKGFDSWHKTHFEMVEALCFIRDTQETRFPKSFAELKDRTATEALYQLAKDLTDKYEMQALAQHGSRTFFEEIEDFVAEEVKNLSHDYFK